MKKYLYLIAFMLMIFGNNSCKTQKKNRTEFLPKGYIISEKIYGDLNKDGVEDRILIIKGTDKKNIVINRFDKEVDRNRRGIIIQFKENDNYDTAVKNHNCFSSENEDGGIYYPAQLSIEVKKGNLYIHYAHGRYGYWSYIFGFQNADFELIGYESSSNYGPVVNTETSINFLTKKKLIRQNTNEDAEGGDEIFEETWEDIEITKLLKLSEIEDFDELDMSYDD